MVLKPGALWKPVTWPFSSSDGFSFGRRRFCGAVFCGGGWEGCSSYGGI